MPASRTRRDKGSDDFETIEGEPDYLKCCICSIASISRDTKVKKTSLSAHKRTEKHKAALQNHSIMGTGGIEARLLSGPVTTEPHIPARLSVAAQFLLDDSDSEEEPTLPEKTLHLSDNILTFDGNFYDALNGEEIMFTAGIIQEASSEAENQIWKEMDELQYYEHTYLADALGDEHEDVTLSNVDALGLIEMESDNDNSNEEHFGMTDENPDWFPHGSKTMFFLDMLDNLPRLRLSDDHMKAIIWIMRECGTPNTPSFSALRKKQKVLAKSMSSITPRHHTSALGNHFYMNHPVDLIALRAHSSKDWANLFVREFIHVYPEITPVISESWQAGKYVEEVDEQLTPMWANWVDTPNKHFYVNEIAQLQCGTFVLPTKWVVYKKIEHAEAVILVRDEFGKFSLYDPEKKCLPAADFKFNYLDLTLQLGTLEFVHLTQYVDVQMPHPVREIAAGRPAFCIRIMPWADDVSGNRSKQYNAHMNLYIANVNLPHRKLAQEYFVRFCSTSPHASASEQFDVLAEDLKSDQWHIAYDCLLNQEIVFRLYGHLLPADNPQQAESSSNAGTKSNYWCRKDMSGGSDAHRETNEGYHALFLPGLARKPETTVEIIQEQIWTAGRGVQEKVDKLQTDTGIKDKIAIHWITQMIEKSRAAQQDRLYTPQTCDARLNDRNVKGNERDKIKEAIKDDIQNELFEWVVTQPKERYNLLPENSELRKQLRPGDHYNPLLKIDGLSQSLQISLHIQHGKTIPGLDAHRDAPCEILHTILLGIDKYLWHDTNTAWDKKKDDQFAIRLQSSSIDGLSLSTLRAHYIVQYKNSLVGKHFKALQQLAIFHLFDNLCSDNLFNLWKANGALGAMIWYPEIRDMDTYIADLDILINNVLDLWAVFDPSRIQYKYKLHIISHLKDDIKRFGPAILFSTEIFECWNAVFRLCSILSNHQAPSHDIATTLADMERFKHQVSGGWWKDSTTGFYIQAGSNVRGFLARNAELHRRLGWADLHTSGLAGTVRLNARNKRTPTTLTNFLKSIDGNGILGLLTDPIMQKIPDIDAENWVECRYLICRSEDLCKPGSWVFFDKTISNTRETMAGQISKIMAASTSRSVVIMDHFEISSVNDARLGMPVLIRSGKSFLVLPTDVLFIFNAQHDCYTHKCSVMDSLVVQGRDQTMRKQSTVLHSETNHYILNMHALHNSHLIRETLPRELSKPTAIFSDLITKHNELAAALRVSGPVKRAETRARAQATRARNKAK